MKQPLGLSEAEKKALASLSLEGLDLSFVGGLLKLESDYQTKLKVFAPSLLNLFRIDDRSIKFPALLLSSHPLLTHRVSIH